MALLVSNRLEVLEVLGACAKAGAVYCGLNYRMSEDEYAAILANAEPRLVICGGEFTQLAARLAAARDIPVLDVDDGWAQLLASGSAAPPPTLHEVRPEDDFCIIYTSGTTGSPKGILFDVRSVVQHATCAITEYDMDPSSRWLMAIPHNSSVQITRAADGDTALFASAGRPAHVVDVRVVDDDGHDVADGERGEVIFGTPYTMKR